MNKNFTLLETRNTIKNIVMIFINHLASLFFYYCPTYREHVFLYVSVKMMEVSKLIKSVDEQL